MKTFAAVAAAVAMLAPGAAPAQTQPAGAYGFTLIDNSQAASGPNGAVLFASQPKAVGAEVRTNMLMVYVVPYADPTANNAVVSYVMMPLAFSCEQKTARQFAPTVVDKDGKVVVVSSSEPWGDSNPVPTPDPPGAIEPAYEAFRLACADRPPARTFASLEAAIAFARATPLTPPPAK
jgi:hypothetical protein